MTDKELKAIMSNYPELFDNLSQFLTAWKNGDIKVTVERSND